MNVERQLSILYVLNNYFKEMFKLDIDISVWIDVVDKVSEPLMLFSILQSHSLVNWYLPSYD